MRVLEKGQSHFVYWEDLVYLEAALLAVAEVQALAALVTAVLAAFPGVLQADLDSRRATVVAEARVAVADSGLDEGIRDVHADTLHDARQDRSAPTVKTLFPENIARTVKHALARQVEVAEVLVGKLALSLFSEAFRTRQRERLGGLIEKGKVALAGRREAVGQRAQVRLTIDEWKDEANAIRLSVYAGLIELGTEQKKTSAKAFADSFFRSYAQPTSNEKKADPDVSEPEGPIEG
jgi:hypothetical protein